MMAKPILYVVDDEAIVRASIISLVEAHGDFDCREYGSGDGFLDALDTLERGCVVLDLQLAGASGLSVMQALSKRTDRFRVIVVTGFGELPIAIDAFRAGAVDFLHKPYEMRPLLDAIDRGFHLLAHGVEPPELVADAQGRFAQLSAIEADILARLMRGETNHSIGQILGLDARTVQVHRARALAALRAPSILAAIRIAAVAGWRRHG